MRVHRQNLELAWIPLAKDDEPKAWYRPMRTSLAALALTLFTIACSTSLQNQSADGGASATDEQIPRGAAGFDFGVAPADIKKACEGAGKSWRSNNNESGICSGPATDIGFDATVRIDFCQEESCVIGLEHRPPSNWLATFNDVKQQLAKRHGTPALMPSKGIPEKCREEAQFAQCLEADGLRQMYRWEWPTRQQVTLTIGKPEEGAGPAAIRIMYVTPPTGARSK